MFDKPAAAGLGRRLGADPSNARTENSPKAVFANPTLSAIHPALSSDHCHSRVAVPVHQDE
jgi:hypothetical protein